MRFKIVARSYRTKEFLLRLEDGRLVRDHLSWVPWSVAVGMTGTIVPGRKGNRMIPDAIDL